ncbi:hypothetical protein Angca_002152, partial [Angiostrongylus cantonensis]
AMLVLQDLAAQGLHIDLKCFFSLQTAEKIASFLNENSMSLRKSREDKTLSCNISLSAQQRRLWFLVKMYPNRDSYVIRLHIDFIGVLIKKRLLESFNLVVMNNSLLRSIITLTNHEPTFLTLSGTECFHALEPNELEDVQVTDSSLVIGQLFERDCSRLDLRIHHIISDGRSLAIIGEQLASAYNGLEIIHDDKLAENDELDDSLDFWREYLEDYEPIAIQGKGKKNGIDGKAGYLMEQLDFIDSLKLEEFCANYCCTLYHIIMLSFVNVLRMTYDLNDVVVGTTIANRSPVNLNRVGLFANTIPLRFKENFPDLERQLRYTIDQILSAMEHQSTSLARIVEDCQPKLIVTNLHFQTLPSPILLIELLEAHSDPRFLFRSCSNSLAYVIYTSGTTGTSKGVCVSHQSTLNMLAHATRHYNFRPMAKVLQLTKSSFDASVSNTFGCLLNGGVLSITSGKEEIISDLCARLPITTLHMTPIILDMLDNDDFNQLHDVERWSFGGETMSESTMNCMIERGYRIVQLYGPTETTCYVTLLEMRRTITPTCLGPVISGLFYGLCSFQNHMVQRKSLGQFYCSGENLARGYIGSVQKGFIENPYRTIEDKILQRNTKIYLSGDRIWCDKNQYLHFLGRKDDQVKIKGQRIQLSEIENVARKLDGVQNVAAVLQKDKANMNQIVLFHTGTANNLLTFLHERLQNYMVPSKIIHLVKFPLTTNGKIDKRNLSSRSDIKDNSTTVRKPKDYFEEGLLNSYREVLKIPDINVCSNFFQVGGHSLLVVRLLDAIQNTFGVSVPIVKVFEFPVVADLARWIKSCQNAQIIPAISKELCSKESDRPTPLQLTLLRSFRNPQVQALYEISFNIMLKKLISAKKLGEIVNNLAMIHPSLRTRFLRINKKYFKEVLSGTECYQKLNSKATLGLDLLQKPPFVICADGINLHLVVNHIIIDGHSMQLVVRNLLKLLNDERIAMDDSHLFHSWIHNQFQKHEADHRQYWSSRLKNFVYNQLPTSHPRLVVRSNQAALLNFHMSQLRKRLGSWVHTYGCTPFVAVLALLSRTLQSISYDPSMPVAVGFPVNLRTHKLRNSVAYGISTVMIAHDTTKSPEKVVGGISMEFSKTIPVSHIQKALLYEIQRHESLRTIFFEIQGEPKQLVLSMTEAYIGLNVEKTADLNRSLTIFTGSPVHLTEGVPLRAVLFETPDYFVAMLRLHHIISDAWSTSMLEQELGEILEKLNAFENPKLQRQTLSYKEYCLKAQPTPVINSLYIDALTKADNIPEMSSYRGGVEVLSFDFSESVAHQWMKRCGVSLFVVMLTILSKSIMKEYGMKNINIGSASSGRSSGSKNVFGYFLNNLVFHIRQEVELKSPETLQQHVYFNCRYDMETHKDDDITVKSLLQAKSEFPFEIDLDKDSKDYYVTLRVKDCLSKGAGESLMKAIRSALLTGASPHQSVSVKDQISTNYPLKLVLEIAKKVLLLEAIDYNENFFSVGGNSLQVIAFIEQIEETVGVEVDISTVYQMKSFLKFSDYLRSIIPAQPFETPNENAQVSGSRHKIGVVSGHPFVPLRKERSTFRNSDVADIPCRSLNTMFHDMMAYGTRQAMIEPDVYQVTYEELADVITRQAAMVRDHYCQISGETLRADTIIPVLGQRSASTNITCLSIMASGSAYLPMDSSWPLERLCRLLDDSHANCYVGPKIAEIDLPNIVVKPMRKKTRPLIKFDSVEDLAYVIYTSGTTGIPKAVCINRRSLVNMMAS